MGSMDYPLDKPFDSSQRSWIRDYDEDIAVTEVDVGLRLDLNY